MNLTHCVNRSSVPVNLTANVGLCVVVWRYVENEKYLAEEVGVWANRISIILRDNIHVIRVNSTITNSRNTT